MTVAFSKDHLGKYLKPLAEEGVLASSTSLTGTLLSDALLAS